MPQSLTQQGIALVSAIAFLAVTALFIGTALLVGVSDRQRSSDNVRTLKAQFAAEAGVERVVYESWYGNLGGTVPDTFDPDLKSFREGLDALTVTDGGEGLTAGEKVGGEYEFGEPRLFTGTLQDGLSYEVSVSRADVGGEKTVLRLDATGWQGNLDNPVSVRRVAEDLVIAPEPGLDYALLTDNANCLFCHTTVTSLEAAYNNPGNRFENTERVKVGGLNSLDADRVSELDSLVTGTLYTRGESNLLDADSTLKGIDLQTHRGRRTNRLGDAGAVPITTLPTYDCATGCDPYGAFYENYPTDVHPDAELPDTFPLPVEDTDGDRLISHAEWQRAVAAELEPGTLSGGTRKELYATTHNSGDKTALNAERTGTTADAALTNGVNGVAGNLVLEGSEANPLILEGTLYIDGDLLIRGAVTGDGKLVARGNIYISGDVTYACDEMARDGTWGSPVTCQYDEPETLPRFGLIAGKNILIGAYQTPYVSSFWESNPGEGLVRPGDQLTRTDLSPSAVSEEDLTRWYLDPGKDEGLTGLSAGDYTAGGSYNVAGDYRFSFTTLQMMLFNQQEFLRSSDPGYTPRYYRMRDGSPVYRCELARGDVAGAGCTTYAEATLVTPNAGDAFISLTPTDSWLAGTATTNVEQASELAVRRAWVEGIESNASRSPGALRVDGLLYARHGLFALNPTTSQTAGAMVLNGALVAADTGLLMPGSDGLNIHYDERLRPFMGLKKDRILVQQRVDYRLLNIDETLTYEGLTP